MGSLCRILSRKLEQIKAVQVKNECNIIRLPGGILGHDMSAKIALQVSWDTVVWIKDRRAAWITA